MRAHPEGKRCVGFKEIPLTIPHGQVSRAHHSTQADIATKLFATCAVRTGSGNWSENVLPMSVVGQLEKVITVAGTCPQTRRVSVLMFRCGQPT